jgi:hypothetical protein
MAGQTIWLPAAGGLKRPLQSGTFLASLSSKKSLAQMHPVTMKKILVPVTFLSASLYFFSCHSRASEGAGEKDSSLIKPVAPVEAITIPSSGAIRKKRR